MMRPSRRTAGLNPGQQSPGFGDCLSNRAIAARLVVTERTVEAHMSSIFGKLELEESPDQHGRVLAVLKLLRA